MISNRVILTVFTLVACVIALPAFGKTLEGTNGLRITMGPLKRPGDGMMSVTAQWRKDESLKYESTGLVLGLGAAKNPPDTGVTLAAKLPKALRKSMEYQYENWRGALMEQQKGADGSPLPEVLLRNREGFALTAVTLRDYTNQKAKLASIADSFAKAEIQVGLDVVGAAHAINPAAATFQVGEKREGPVVSGGVITVAIGEGEPVQIDTRGKTPDEIEKLLAEKLASNGARTGGSPIVPDTTDENVRWVPPFDGSEVQFPNLQAKSITIDVNDPNLGVITKFLFKDPGAGQATDILTYLIPIFLMIGLGAGYFYKDRLFKKEDTGV